MEISAVKPEKLKWASIRIVSGRERVRVAPPAQWSARDNGFESQPHSVARRADTSGSFSLLVCRYANGAQGVAQRRSAEQGRALGAVAGHCRPLRDGPVSTFAVPVDVKVQEIIVSSIGQNNA